MIKINPYFQILENSSRNFSKIFIFRIMTQTRDERTRVSDVCPCPRFSDMPLSEPVSVSEVMTLSESMSESVSEV